MEKTKREIETVRTKIRDDLASGRIERKKEIGRLIEEGWKRLMDEAMDGKDEKS